MTQADIDAPVEAYGRAAQSAKELGFDGVELHAAHGYLIDQFFWEGTNQCTWVASDNRRNPSNFLAV